MEMMDIQRKLQRMEKMYVLSSEVTNRPFLTRDEEGQLWIDVYEVEEEAQAQTERLAEADCRVKAISVANEQFLAFYSSLYAMGIENIALHLLPPEARFAGQTERIPMELSQIVRRQEFSEVPPERRPVENPRFQLVSLYFAQEARRKPVSPENTVLREYERESVEQLRQSRLLIPTMREGDQVGPRLIRMPNGDIVQPVFTDLFEYESLLTKRLENEVNPTVVPFLDIEKALLPDVAAIVINPAGFALTIHRQQLGRFLRPESAVNEQIPENQRKLWGAAELYCVFSDRTNHPFLSVGGEAENDQIHLYCVKAEAEAAVEEWKARKNPVHLMTIPRENFPGFCYTYFCMNVDDIVLHDGGEETTISLDEIVVKATRPPLSETTIQLTGIYYMQEVFREVSRSKKPDLDVLEEALFKALAESAFFVPSIKNEAGEPGEPLLLKSSEEKTFRPVFTDMLEVRRFDPKGALAVVRVPFVELEAQLPEGVEGLAVNPTGINLVMTRARLASLKAEYYE